MDLNLICDVDLETLEEELTCERLDFKDVSKYIIDLKLGDSVKEVDNVNGINQELNLKLIRICQVLLKFASEKWPKGDRTDKYVFQCTNCSKAFRRSEYLENHIQRRHGNKSLAENGLFPLIEQIKRYKSGLFVESSSIDDLKDEIKNLQTCLKETCEDLIKEKIAREQLQKIIESEIIEKLNSLQETWSEPKEDRNKGEDEESDNSNEQTEQQLDNRTFENLNNQSLSDVKNVRNFDLFLLKQNELIEKLGKNIDRFVERNESKVNDEEHLQNFISNAIHREIECLITTNEQKEIEDKKVGKETIKSGKKGNKNSSKRFSMNTIRKDAIKQQKDEIKRESLHEFSIQNHLNNANQIKDHTDEIVHEINQMISDETLVRNQTKPAVSFTSKIRKFPFKFRKSKSLNHLNGDESKKDESNKTNATNEQVITDGDQGELNETIVNDDKNKDESKLNEKVKDSSSETEKSNEKPAISRFRQFVWKKSDSQDNQENKINLNKFSTKSKVDDEMNNNEVINDMKSNQDKGDSVIGENRNGKQVLPIRIDQSIHSANESVNNNKTLKSVLKKSNSTDSNLQHGKLPKKSIAFSDERIEFSAEELDSSDTGSSYSLTGNSNYLSSGTANNASINFNYTLQPTEQIVTVQKVIERPTPAPRFVQQKSLSSL